MLFGTECQNIQTQTDLLLMKAKGKQTPIPTIACKFRHFFQNACNDGGEGGYLNSRVFFVVIFSQ